MNGEIPSVPITTLAGISSLTDLLPEMPLPSPMVQTLNNKSLLFHPRVAEEANILLSLLDDNLIPQLIQSLNQTPALNIEFKNQSAVQADNACINSQGAPDLLKAILCKDPHVFDNVNSEKGASSFPGVGISNSSVIVNAANDSKSEDSLNSLSFLKSLPSKDICNDSSSVADLYKALGANVSDSPSKDISSIPPSDSKTTPFSSLSESTLPSFLESPCTRSSVSKEVNNQSSIFHSLKDDSLPSTPSKKSFNLSETSNQMNDSKNISNNTSSDEKSPVKKESQESTRAKNKQNKNTIFFDKLSTKDQELMQKSLSEYVQKASNKFGFSKNHVTEGDIKEQGNNNDMVLDNKPAKTEIEETKEPVKIEEDTIGERSKRRKRIVKSETIVSPEKNNVEEETPPKAKIRKIEKVLVPVIEKLNVEELMESNTYQRFNRTIDQILDDVEPMEDSGEEDEDCPSEALISKYQLQDLCGEAAKLKTLGAMESIPTDRIVRLLTILEKNIRDGIKVSPVSDPNDGEEERKLFIELAMERVMRAVDASLTALYILTSPNMHKQVYLEDVIDRIVIYTKFQLHNTIYPAFDPVYRIESKDGETVIGSGRKKRGHFKEVREKNLLNLYNKLSEVVLLLGELLDIQKLTDNSVLHATSMGISPFFVEGVSDLQLSALKLVTTIFMKYDKHRKLLLDDMLASMARLPSSKRGLRSYRLSGEEYIQMVTALVLQLVQCMVVVPSNLESTSDPGSHPDIIIGSKFKSARTTASNFLYAFLAKCSSKNEEIDYRPIFENFVQDLLTTVNKPEWPAAELLLSVLGNLLVNNFVNKNLDITLRVASLDYLGVVAARLRKDTVTSALKLSKIDQLIKDIQSEEVREDEKSYKNKKINSEEERTQFLQRVLLDFLAMKGQSEPTLNHARHFYIAQWYHDCCTLPASPSPANKKSHKKKKKKRKDESEDEPSDSEPDEETKESLAEEKLEHMKIFEAQKKFLMSKIRPFHGVTSGDATSHILQTYIDYDSAELIARYLASKRPFSQSFDRYLKHILKVLTETSVLIRTKAMKCLTSIVEVDPSVLGLKEMQLGVSHSFLDHSTSVREAAVDLVGKFILSRPELIAKYYDMLSARILDTGVSVRKRVIKILKDVCIECPDFPKIPEICMKIIRRVNDEDGIRKLVLEVFQNMWFTPVREKPVLDSDTLVRKVINMTDVIAVSNDVSIDWLEQLLISLFKPQDDKEDKETGPNKGPPEIPRSILLACKQIVDCLVEMVLRLDGLEDSSQRLVSCHMMLFLFARIHPQLIVHHATTLQPYLSLKCQTHEDYQIISCVARTLELVVPLIEHPSEMFLSRLEEDSVKLMMQQDPIVVSSCVSCLGSVVNNVTRNFSLIRDCLKNYFGFLKSYKNIMESGNMADIGPRYRPSFRRSLFVVGLLLRFFDFTNKEVLGDQVSDNIKNEVFETLMYFLVHDDFSQQYTLKAIGNICIRYYDLMLGKELKDLYHRLLTELNAPLSMKTQVLTNIELYLQEEERRMIKLDQEWAKLSKQENLKEMGDVTSGMASTVIQVYLKEILESFLHPQVSVRNAALRVIQLILAQGLVHPVQIVPYLICMSSDEDKTVSHAADKQLQDIEKKYPGFIHMKAKAGIRLSFQLQKIIHHEGVIRGFRTKEGELPSALNGFLYSALRTKQQRRALILSILKQFDEQVKTSLSFMLYLSDNMAYFPYQVQDEPLFIIHHIDIIISVTGTNLLQSFREGLIPVAGRGEGNGDDEEDEDEESLLSRVPEDTTPLLECLVASQGCLLLLVLKQHLKSLYGFNDAKITQYSPSESAKVYEKAVNRKSNSKFNPKATLQKLKEGTPPSVLDENARRALISEYLEFKTLIMNLDPDDVDDMDDGPQNTSSEGGALRVRELIAKKVTQESEMRAARELEASQPRVPKLTIIASKGEVRQHRTTKTRKAERHKKHHHRRKKKHKGSDDSDDEYSDPDYLV